MGVRADGTKEPIAMTDGYRESAESCASLLRDCQRRGMRAPVLAVAAGALGFWNALNEVSPEPRRQRCWVHKTANCLDTLPKSAQPAAKKAIQDICNADGRLRHAETDLRIAAAGDDIGWSGPPSDELFQWWLDHEQASGLSLYGRKLWETMSSYWPTGDQQPNATPAEIEFARNWRDTPKVVFSSTIDKVDWNTRLVTGDAIAEITRLKAEDGGPMNIGGATLAGRPCAPG